jgi:hypothetical protein
MATRSLIWDLQDPSGPAEVDHWSTDNGESLERDPLRYVKKLPPGLKPGPRTGTNRIIR